VSVRTYVGIHDGARMRIAVVAARFNQAVTSKLVEGAVSALSKHGVASDRTEVAWVPGAFEIPLVAKRLAATGRYDAVIGLGAVIRGDTAHFDLVAEQAARGIMDIALETGVPVIFEVLATDDLAQAEARAGGLHGNKGWEAAESAIEMASLLSGLPVGEPR
jgi:6,7-dimethyl-8-ribityllumazine synthase